MSDRPDFTGCQAANDGFRKHRRGRGVHVEEGGVEGLAERAAPAVT